MFCITLAFDDQKVRAHKRILVIPEAIIYKEKQER